MNPRLVAIAGPHQGVTFTVTQEETSIGRDATNSFCIADSSVSRRHCVIRRQGEEFAILDQESRNGTFVNDIPAKERSLRLGDRIEIGDSLFLFVPDETESPPASNPAHTEDALFVARTTLELHPQDTLYLQQKKPEAETPPERASGLSNLLRISSVIHSIRNLEGLQRKLLEMILEVIPAGRAAILMTLSNSEVACNYALDRRTGSDQPFPFSRTIVQRVLQERVAILSNDLRQDETLRTAASIISLRTTSLLAVPLVVFERLLGVLYLDTSDSNLQFEEDHLHLLTAIADMAAMAMENVRHLSLLEDENIRLQSDIQIEHNMVGEGARMREVYEWIRKVAHSSTTILICGESGTGKELVARAIHQNSGRATKPFIAINCAALPDSLLESELFGHEKGAFTGAITQKKGKLEIADGGTVLLDEVAEIPLPLQSKLLRVLQEREFDRVGGTRPVKIDVRYIAATNRNLEGAIQADSFRQDLYYRLNVVSITMPPLRERKEDIPLLASYFASKHAKRSGRRMIGISADARACLVRYNWPGNVRELENVIERAVLLGTLDLILPEDLPEALLEAEEHTPGVSFYDSLRETKKQLILKALQKSDDNHNEAAKLLGIHPNNLYRLIRNLNLKPPTKS